MKKSISSKPVILLGSDTPFAIRESFNHLRTNLMYTFPEQESCPAFGITSVNENVGKSTIIANLAVSFAQIRKRVLLIDGDMRCPTLFRFFDIDAKHAGLSELISGIENDVVISDVAPGLDLITAGRIPPHPSELLVSNRLKELLAEWKRCYDIIFFDFPPVELITDALSLCQELNGYLFGISSGHNRAKDVTNWIESMEQVGAKIVGVVLNDYNIKGSGTHYRNRYSSYRKYNSYHSSHYEASYQENCRHEAGNKRGEA